MYFIDGCDYCGCFHRVTVVYNDSTSENVTVCDECFKMYEDIFFPDESYDKIDENSFEWQEV